MTYKPVRPAFSGPTLLKKDAVARQIWGDDVSGEVADAIYISNDKIHLMIFSMAPGGGFEHSRELRTIFDADELYYVLSGTLVINNPETGEVHVVRPGEAAFFRSDTWHHAYCHGTEPVQVLEFIAPGPLSGNTQAYARTKPFLETVKTRREDFLGRWPMERANVKNTMTVMREADVLWGLEGADQKVLVGLWASTDRVTIGTLHLHPGQRSDIQRHGGDECVFVLDGHAGVRLPENDGATWFELDAHDGLYLPGGTPHRYQNFSGQMATLFFIVGPRDGTDGEPLR
jgi:quercetin dioxygenase-like cupin family protein